MVGSPGVVARQAVLHAVLAQIHLQADGRVHLFSRNCEDRSASFPDVADAVRAAAAGAPSPETFCTLHCRTFFPTDFWGRSIAAKAAHGAALP